MVASSRVTGAWPIRFVLVRAITLVVVVVTGPSLAGGQKAGWQRLFFRGCDFAVPVSWHPNDDASMVQGPDGSNLTVRMFRITNWSAHKAQLKTAFVYLDRVHEDSERRFWFEIGHPSRVQHFIDVLSGPVACNGLLEIHTTTTLTADDLRRIADSIAPRPSHGAKITSWP
jgi:hypothetical protein